MLRGWQLWFRGVNHSAVATIEKNKAAYVPVLIWRLQPKDEFALDHYEGWPSLYRKEALRITVNGKRVYAMVYIMNIARYSYGMPSMNYFNTIRQGYRSAGFDMDILYDAVNRSKSLFKNF